MSLTQLSNKGYVNYEFLFEEELNYEYVCAQTVGLDNEPYTRTDLSVAGRKVYKDEFGEKFLFRKGKEELC